MSGSQNDTPDARFKGEAVIRRNFTASFPAAGADRDLAVRVLAEGRSLGRRRIDR